MASPQFSVFLGPCTRKLVTCSSVLVGWLVVLLIAPHAARRARRSKLSTSILVARPPTPTPHHAMSSPSSPPSPPPPQPEWSRLVKLSLHPRLIRLPLLTLIFLHTSVIALHILSSSNTSSILLSPFKPTLIICTLVSFTISILPALIIRRRLLSRRGLEKLLCSNQCTQAVELISGQPKLIPNSIPARLIHSFSQSSTWISAFFHAIFSSIFTLSLSTSIALYSDNPSWWIMPYHLVPSTRRTTGSFGRIVSTTQEYWRPNEIFWSLVFQPFFSAFIVNLIAQLWQVATASIPPPRIPPFPASLVDCLAPDVSVKRSLTARITATVPRKIAIASLLHAAIALAVFTLYLPIRLPLFRLYLALLPPWSGLRRLCIPTLRTGYGLTATSNLLTLLAASTTMAAIQGATLAVAVNLWEIYATHPMAITSSNLSAKPIETLLSALEIYAPTNNKQQQSSSSPAEQHFLFTHALFDLTTLSTDTTTQGADKRRAFFKHFAIPATATAPNGTLSAWERLSEVLMAVVKAAVSELSGQGKPEPQVQTQPAVKHPAAAAAAAAPPPGKELQVKDGGVVGSPPSAPATSTAVSQPSPQQTVWHRLVTQPPTSATAAAASTPQPQPQPPPTPRQPSLLTRIPPLQSALTRLITLANDKAKTTSSSSSHLTCPLSLILISHSILRLLPLSIHEDEWGSVTLSDRRALGVDEWCALFHSLAVALAALDQDVLTLLLKAEVDDGLARTRREFAL